MNMVENTIRNFFCHLLSFFIFFSLPILLWSVANSKCDMREKKMERKKKSPNVGIYLGTHKPYHHQFGTWYSTHTHTDTTNNQLNFKHTTWHGFRMNMLWFMMCNDSVSFWFFFLLQNWMCNSFCCWIQHSWNWRVRKNMYS